MIPKEIVERVNHFARKARTEGLTNEEKIEQKAARETYLEMIRSQVRSALDNMTVKDMTQPHSPSCGCGCHGKDHHHTH